MELPENELLRRIAEALEERNKIEREKIGMTPVARTSAVRMAEVFTAEPEDMEYPGEEGLYES